METKIFDDRDGAELYLKRVYPNTVPKETICYKAGPLVWNVWNGNRAFEDTDVKKTGDFQWARCQDVAFSNDEKTIHLGEYWYGREGFYVKK